MKYLHLKEQIIEQLELGNIILVNKTTGEPIDISQAILHNNNNKNKVNIDMQFVKVHIKNVHLYRKKLTKIEYLHLLALIHTVRSNHTVDCGILLSYIGKDRAYRLQNKFFKHGIIKKLTINDKQERIFLNPTLATASKSIDKEVLKAFKQDIIDIEIYTEDEINTLLKIQ